MSSVSATRTCSAPKAFCPLASACSSRCLRLVIRAEAAIGPAHHRQQLGLQFGLAGEFLLHLFGAGIEQGAHGRLA